MKKTLAAILAAAMLCSVTACGDKKAETTAAETTAAQTETAAETASETEGTAAAETEEALVEPEYVSAFDLGPVSDYVKLGEYKNLTVTDESTEVTEEELQAELQSRLDNSEAVYEQITEGVVKDGDVVNLDYSGSFDGEVFEGGTAEGALLTIGSGQFIPGFEDQLIGKKIGDTFDITVTFPDPYELNPDYAGKEAVFRVTINSVQGEEIQKELNDEFASLISNGEYATLEEYREFVRGTMTEDKVSAEEDRKVNEYWSQIQDNAEFIKEPEELITYIHDSQMYQLKSSLQMYGMTMDDYLQTYGMTEEEMETQLSDYAKETAHSQMLIRAIVEAENLQVEGDAYDTEIQKIADQYGYTAESLKGNYPEVMLKDIIYQSLIKTFMQENMKTAN